MTRYILLGLTFLLSTLRTEASTEPDDLAGRVIGTGDGRQIELPLLRSAYSVNIEGDMATVEVTQTFENPSALPMEARYLFPLNQRAAVYGMEMRVGDEVIEAVIREKAKAVAEFQAAAQEGKAAALLTQHRPNMFTQDIANLMPGQPIEVRLRYVQMVPKIDGKYQLVIPLIVGPRYRGADLPDEDQIAALDGQTPTPVPPGTWQIADVPAYPGVAGLDLPETITGDRVSLDVAFTSGFEMSGFGSATHPLDIVQGDAALTAGFAKGEVLDNRDLVLHYGLEGSDVQAAVLSHTDDRGGYLSVMIEPPVVPDDAQITPRELVFVLDTSGSMNGAPMAASKRFMTAALAGLRGGDYFRIIPFSNTAQEMSQTALPATAQNIRAADRYVRNLTAAGGTEIDRAIRTAFATRPVEDTMRIVVFLSDGYIGNEHTVLKTIRDQIGTARIYAFGVGSSVNRYLLDGMAEEGRGYARYVGLDEDALEIAETLARDLKSPLLTDITIDWGDLAVEDVSLTRIPDLFAGNSVRVYARHSATGAAEVKINGLVNGRAATMSVPLTLTAGAREPALPLIWARNRIAMLERNVAVGVAAESSDAEITKLGLDYGLQTKNTSFVAVSQKVVNDAGLPALTRDVPLPMVHGVGPSAYPQGFSGSSTPEPQAWLGMVLLAALSLMRLLQGRGRPRVRPANA
ncbi:MAG: VIT and VWA domain-containing protein [Pseudomonadota bacterium]